MNFQLITVYVKLVLLVTVKVNLGLACVLEMLISDKMCTVGSMYFAVHMLGKDYTSYL